MIPQRIIWHHSADASPAPQFEKIDRYHKSKGFPRSSLGFYVGYHWLIETDGAIKLAREEDEIGAHDAGENPNSLGICLAGNFNITQPTDLQKIAVVRLLSEIKSRWPIPLTRIEPHRWDDDTECPGTLLPDNWLADLWLEREGTPALKVFNWIGKKYGLL